MDGWNTTFLLGRPIFRGYVSFREGIWRVPAFVPMNVWLPKSVLAGTPIPWNQQTSIGFSLVDSRPISSSWNGPPLSMLPLFWPEFLLRRLKFFWQFEHVYRRSTRNYLFLLKQTERTNNHPCLPPQKNNTLNGIRTTWPSYDSGNEMVMLATFVWILCARPKRIST